MDRFDLIVIGSGAGMHVVSSAVEEGMRVALVDQGPVGGTCLNNGCIPSKILIYPADVIRNLQQAGAVGVQGSIEKIEFPRIMNRMHAIVAKSRERLEEFIDADPGVTFFRSTAEFIDNYTLEAGGKTLTAPKIAIATGARPLVPKIRGLEETGYLDNISLLNLEAPPKSLIIIGAGYIGCEYGHFFSAMGTEVTILGRSPQVLNNEDPEICRIVKDSLGQNLRIVTSHEVVKVEMKDGKKVVSAKSRVEGKISLFEADEILLAAGRRSNADLLKPEKTGVETDDRGWIRVNDYLETTKEGIWAFGDAIGKHMFRHTANYEAEIVAQNALRAKKKDDREKVDFHAIPHAVFTHPTVAGVGMKEAEALEAGLSILVGRARYTDVAKGLAMAEEHGFVKVMLEEGSGRILGASIAGSSAPELVQQVVYLMNTEYQDLMPMIKSQVIHPTISEVLVKAFSRLEHPIPESRSSSAAGEQVIQQQAGKDNRDTK
jgi:mycothione reductase